LRSVYRSQCVNQKPVFNISTYYTKEDKGEDLCAVQRASKHVSKIIVTNRNLDCKHEKSPQEPHLNTGSPRLVLLVTLAAITVPKPKLSLSIGNLPGPACLDLEAAFPFREVFHFWPVVLHIPEYRQTH